MPLAPARAATLDRLPALWGRGAAARNGWLTVPDPYLAEIVAASGAVDAVTIDMQHGLFDRRTAVEAIRAAAGQGIPPLVRLPQLDAALIGFLLDADAAGLILPGVDGAAQAEAFVAACRYPPAGSRSHGPTRAALAPPPAAGEPVRFAMIETAAGLQAVRAIAAVEGLDGLFVGPGDLGVALGLGPGQDRAEPAFNEALDAIAAAARAAGKRLGIHAATAAYAARMAGAGFALVTLWVDAVALRASLAAAERDWQAAAAGSG